ncbi:tripartite tricarboxylate transporter TctB family protein [Chelativorans sp. M5D2P16]|uniref:tripartite tricarboxylate transporter TctB family protein n=1 Tax=Chelativorans sp. M5D2P16 TaxID=3095678 RepID=UPI002ACADD85|nr:tripartite tricarboxylate transporter TctB family protein [Chelativorans sp. M5D2P16]MDZ5695922.1 tripartite tricarboxylate transporter TctB family protein [Chelativorans sp. M5D2P16]
MSQNSEPAVRGGRDWAGAAGSVLFAAVGVYVFLTSFAMSPMAAMFPRTIGAAMAVLSVLQVVASLTGRSGRSLEAGDGVRAQADGLGRRLSLVAIMVGWAFLFPVIGIFVTSFLACIGLMFTGTFGRPTSLRLSIYLAVVFVMVVFFYLLMSNVLNIPMPRGLTF